MKENKEKPQKKTCGEGAIIRVHKSANFSVLNNQGLRDARLSFGARGILAYLLTKPDDWTVLSKDLVAESPHGRDAILKMLQELEACGYLKRERTRGADGRYGWLTEVFETPELAKEHAKQQANDESPKSDFPTQVKPTTKEILTKEKGGGTTSPKTQWKQRQGERPFRASEYGDAVQAQRRQHRIRSGDKTNPKKQKASLFDGAQCFESDGGDT
jgi:hypothetical protein